MSQAVQMTPMLRHYSEVKAEHPDAIVLYRMGDFYEVFFDDAVRVAPILEVTLTARHRGKESEAPMCGVPHHALEVYLGKLLRAGLKVAICDQVEDPAQAKGLVHREVTRVVTPGTVSDPDLLHGTEDNLLGALVWMGQKAAGAFLDISTGVFFVRNWDDVEDCLEELRSLAPKELLLQGEAPPEVEAWVEQHEVCSSRVEPGRWFSRRKPASVLERQFGVTSLKGYGLEDEGGPAVTAAATALAYARETQRSELSHVDGLSVRVDSDRLVVDPTTLANLEVLRALRSGERSGTLLAVMDRTVTPSGGRLLRDWLKRPLRGVERIGRRHQAVEALIEAEEARGRLRNGLRSIGDPERLVARAVLGTLPPREAAALRDALQAAPAILAEVAECRSELLVELAQCDPVADLAAECERVLSAEPAASVEQGGVIASGVDDDLDRLRSLATDSKKHLLAMEKAERESTGISSLKVRFNRVFGYYIEVTKANQELVPERYIRKQTLVNAERYITPELKELEEQVLSAEERSQAIEAELFAALRAEIAAQGPRVIGLARALAALDVLVSFAEVAARGGYSRPEILPPGAPLEIEGGRHPVVERLTKEFVPNDAFLDAESCEIVVLTGPNMGGKSTYLRQVALIVLLAQAGSFVPAARARIPVHDRIFTRVGASDDLSRGESTFMVEMIETAHILRHATPDSLVILDEVGRGTATFDGLSLAWATVEYLHEKVRCRTLFATHFHELTELSAILPRVVNRTMAVREWENQIVFLRRVVPGSADKSYGLHVAKLAGLPAEVVDRAAEILGNLEAEEYDLAGKPRRARGTGAAAEQSGDQLRLFAPVEEVVASVIRGVDLEQLTPVAALNLLNSLKARLDG